MGIGAVGISTSQKKEPVPQPGPPFTSDSAENGLSVDPVSGKIVLGNDFGDASAPARLTSNREIITEDGAGVLQGLFLNAPTTGIITFMNGTNLEIFGVVDGTMQTISLGGVSNATSLLQVTSGPSSSSRISAVVESGYAAFELGNDSDALTIYTNGAGEIIFQLGNLIDLWRIDTANFTTQIGATLQASNNATLQVNGTITFRRLVQSSGGPTYNVDRDVDSGKLFRNSAAVNFVLPNMFGANSRPGFVFRARVLNAGGVTITQQAGFTINFGSLVTSAGGTLSSVTVGSTITITYDGDGWVTESFTGVWNIT